MKITKLKDLSQRDYQRIMLRSAGTNSEIIPEVRKTMAAIEKYGDKVLVENFRKKYGEKNYFSLKVTRKEISDAYGAVSKEFITALKQMMKNISAVHLAQLPFKNESAVNSEKGISVWREWRPIEKVGLYIPGGKAVYPSSVLMTAIPAKIAGCREIIMCSPPRNKGQVPAPTLVAADMAGIRKIFKVGGAEAIAAMTFGTQTIPAVYKIFGAGNSFVTAAKMLALEEVAIDMPAGPSEIFIIADSTANPGFIAADLLADGEHGPDSACVLLTTSNKVAVNSIREIEKQLKNLATANYIRQSMEKYGLIVLAESIDEAINFSNEYAPEHLEIMVKNPEILVAKITNAGSVFLGNWTSKSAGDYATGANHILPTGGFAKMYPPLGVDAFGKWMQVQKCSRTGLKSIRKTIETIAESEGLPAHKNSTAVRFTNAEL